MGQASFDSVQPHPTQVDIHHPEEAAQFVVRKRQRKRVGCLTHRRLGDARLVAVLAGRQDKHVEIDVVVEGHDARVMLADMLLMTLIVRRWGGFLQCVIACWDPQTSF